MVGIQRVFHRLTIAALVHWLVALFGTVEPLGGGACWLWWVAWGVVPPLEPFSPCSNPLLWLGLSYPVFPAVKD